MSMDRSLKSTGGLGAKRSVMTRAERIGRLTQDKRLDPKKPKALGLPKTLIPKV